MPASVVIVQGSAGAGKTDELLRQCRTADAAGRDWLWLGPTERACDAVASRLGMAARGNRVTTFLDLARRVVRTAAPDVRLLSEPQQRLVLAECVTDLDRARRLRYFAEAAEGPGFADAVYELISEFRERGVAPQQLRTVADRTPGGPKHHDVAAIYGEYDRRLAACQLLDRGALMHRAAEVIRSGRGSSPAGGTLVFVDGFVDFTPPQIQVLGALAQRAGALWVSLPCDHPDDEERPAAFDRARDAAERIRQLAAETAIVCLDRGEHWTPPPRPPALDHLERSLFRSNPDALAASSADVHLIEAPGEWGEVRMVARRIKSELLAGATPDQILVTARSLAEYADLIDDVFAEYGIPADLDVKPPLYRKPAVATLLRAWRLRDDGFPFRETTALLRSTLFQPLWPEALEPPDAPLRAEVALRALGVPRGRDAYLRAIDRWATAPEPALEDDEASNSARARRHEMVRDSRPFLVRFFSAWDSVSDRATVSEHILALRRLADELGLSRVSVDGAALEALFDALGEWQAVNERLHRGPVSMSSIAFGGLAQRLAQSAWAAPPSHDRPRVRVVTAEVARAMDCDQMFILGLGEQSFPDLSVGGPIYSEAERRDLRDAGLDVRIAADRLPDERLLFLQLIGKPRRRLTFSYSATDKSGIALLRSSFLDAALALFPESAISRQRRELLIEGFDSDPPLCPSEYRIRWALLDSQSRPRRDGELFDHLRRVETMARQRFHETTFGRFDGLLADAGVRTRVADRFGPDYVFSPSALESYINCPFQFFLGRVLGLAPLSDPGDQVEPAPRGQVIHRALARLHRRRRDVGRHQPDEELTDELIRDIDSAVDEMAVRSGSAAGRELWRLEGRWLHRAAQRYASQWSRFLESWRQFAIEPQPAEFELDFTAAGDGEQPRRHPLRIADGGESACVSGRVDRLDIAELPDGAKGFFVFDYKTGRGDWYSETDVRSLLQIQLPVYAMLVEQSLPGLRPLGLAYWLFTGTRIKTVMPNGPAWLADAGAWPRVRRRLIQWILALARFIRAAEFPLHPRKDDCTARCDYGQVCRIAQSRHVGKQWNGPPRPEADA
mgnify:CR=1 FL=1